MCVCVWGGGGNSNMHGVVSTLHTHQVLSDVPLRKALTGIRASLVPSCLGSYMPTVE